ncbi:MAG: putative oxidoreductase [Bacteroidetes bacterium ADurb.Bin123]|nr:MAG: putative oxidoreductase [Bacteroidetes bacterium ADurb.Bin123]
MTSTLKINRRRFLETTAAAAAGFTILPRSVFGGRGHTAPSDQLAIAYIGCGTQGLREMTTLIADPSVRIVAVCDPNKFTTDYVDWSANGLKNDIRRALGDPSWGSKMSGIPGGRDVGQEFVQKYYAKAKGVSRYSCPSYADFRELFEKEKDFDTVKIMTPDHLHAAIAIAAMRKGKHVVTHKPIANRMNEARRTIALAGTAGVGSHLLAWSYCSGYDTIKGWIDAGFIGTLREIHNWSNRPVWPQWQANPSEVVPVPGGFDWPLWLGPVPDRPYHPHYTHAVFRGWYDFGGGSIADMGHYSLFPLFLTLGIQEPSVSAEAYGTTTSILDNGVSRGLKNDVAFPLSCMIRFHFTAGKTLPPFDLIWYDGGMRPLVPEELRSAGKTLSPEGMMFVGDKGKIISGFRGEKPVLVPESKMKWLKQEEQEEEGPRGNSIWIDAFRNGTPSPGSFIHAGPVTETILMGAVALQAGKIVEYDASAMKITNLPEANRFLTREYRPGWEL